MYRRQLCAFLLALATVALIPMPASAAGTRYTPVTLPADFLGTNYALMHGTISLEGKKGFVAFQIRRASARRYLGHTTWRRFGPGLTNVTFDAFALNLQRDTDYVFRAVSYVGGIQRSGSSLTFHTLGGVVPTVSTLAASDITTGGAVLNGSVNPNGQPTLAWFEWGTTTNYGNVTAVQNIPAGTNSVPLLATLSSLVAGTTYHFRAVGTNSAGRPLGTDVEFTTLASNAPTVTTLAASSVTITRAGLNGSVNPNGQDTQAWFEWGTTTDYGNVTPVQEIPAGTDPVPAPSTLSNLVGNATYFCRLVARNAGGLALGDEVSFSTLPVSVPPAVLTLTPTNITTNSATLRANVNPNGGETVVWFEWGTSMGYGNKTPDIILEAGEAAVGIVATLSNLTAGSLYYFRVVAMNQVGSEAGGNQIFATTTSIICPPEDSVATVVNCTEADLLTAITNARTVTFACDGVILLTSPLVVPCALRLDASGHSVVLSGGNTNRLFYVHSGAELELIHLTVADGRVTGTNGLPATGPNPSQWGEPGESMQGGGIVVSNGTLRAMNCLFTNCSAAAGWGGDAPSVNWGRGDAGDVMGGLIFASDSAVTLSNCTLAGNAAVAGWSGYGGYDDDPSRTPGAAFGGAMAAINTAVSVTNCIFNLNSAASRGGAIYSSGSNAVLLAGQSTFAGNTVETVGGAINVQSGSGLIAQCAFVANHVLGNVYTSAGGGALAMFGGAVDVLDCDFFGNDCFGGNAVTNPVGIRSATSARGGAVAALVGVLSVSRSTFRGNAAYGGNGLDGLPTPGNPASAHGGAIYVGTTARITNSTFVGNQARAGSGPGISSGSSYGGAVAAVEGNIMFASTTIASNTVSDINGSDSFGAGLYRSAGTVSILNSLLAGNFANTSTSQNLYGLLTDLGHNLSSDATPIWTSGTSVNNTDPLLGPLSDNGGFTLTFPLLPGSPAIDAADPITAPAGDQRGVARPQGPAPDIGSFEKQ